ncbi:hypothetical protein FIV42_25460 [Persicimonas caeni]|uniref:NodB homology domain-containing protein n=1 Tax=Persicimonas caeni TaxID=2292766 RepID=A0A4Y6Q160_PERCE|nr:hypothetical protein [Persicimonas caeni]QDG53967.1 hypothetical protein FIV42_25460 [Persicimonas caeni]QED35188.1 hypothetical protein FRD00_25455 [Persicimonas caeni]
MARKQSILGALKWDFILLALIAAGFGLTVMLDEPHFQPSESPTTTGSRPPDRTEGDVLLLLPDTPAAEAAKFTELDCSYGWFNGLWQHFGSFATALNRNLSPEMLAGRSVVIVPRRVAAAMPSTGISALAGFARNGGQIIVEQPGEGWELLTGVSTAGKERMARTITSTEGLDIHGPMRKHLPDTPLTGKLLPAPPMDAHPAGPMLLEVDSQPGLTVNQLGQGHVYAFLFDFGCTVTALQQGRPTEGMRFGREPGAEQLPVDARAAHKRMLTSHVPYADLLERALFHRLSEVRPMPRLWMFPGQMAGAVMLTHPTPENLRAAIGYADWARKNDASSTVFVASDIVTPTEASLLRETGAEIGLLWVNGQTRDHVTEPVGVGAIKPIKRELTLTQQRQQLSMAVGGEKAISFGRVEDSIFANDWDTTLRQLRKAGLQVDNSFGPTDPEHYGYLFGTGFPYYPVDDRGLPLPILEYPFVLQGKNANVDRLKRMLGNSEAYFHESLVISLPSTAMRTEPSPGILLTFRNTFDLAEEYRHWMTTIGEFHDFLSARRQSVLTSQWSSVNRRLTISVNLLGARASSVEGGAIPGVAFPRTWDGEEIERVVVDGEEISLRKLVTTGSSFERIVRVGPGRHTISVFYKAPPVEELEELEE